MLYLQYYVDKRLMHSYSAILYRGIKRLCGSRHPQKPLQAIVPQIQPDSSRSTVSVLSAFLSGDNVVNDNELMISHSSVLIADAMPFNQAALFKDWASNIT